jgi:hypothetical protein
MIALQIENINAVFYPDEWLFFIEISNGMTNSN